MRYRPGHKEETRNRILASAERAFSANGYGSVGVDALAEQAGITSGAFYGHFRSKAEVFRAAAAAGLTRLRQGIETFHANPGQPWVRAFMEYYLAPPFRQGLEGGCALPSLSGEVARSDASTRSFYEAEMLRLLETLSASLQDDEDSPARTRAWTMLALLAGGATLARSVENPAVAKEIAAAVTDAVVRVAGEGGQSAAPRGRVGVDLAAGCDQPARTAPPPGQGGPEAQR